MAIKRTYLGVDASNGPNLGFDAEVGDLTGLFFLGGTLAASAVNKMVGGPAATVAGSPTVATGYLGLQGQSKYLTLPAAATNGMTLAVVCRSNATFADTANRPGLIGNTGGGGTGQGIYVNAASSTDGAQIYGQVRYSASANAIITVPNFRRWTFLALTITDGVGHTIYSKTDGISTTTANATTRAPNAGVAMTVGSISNSSFLGTCEVAIAMTATRALSSAELDLMVVQARAVMALSGQVLS